MAQSRVGKRRPISIVMYHSVGEVRDRYTVSPAAFARQIERIRREFTVIRLRDLAGLLSQEPGGARRVVITFDDAFQDFYHTAYPMLQRWGLSSTVFVPSGYVGRHNEWDAGAECHRKPLMSAAQLAELQREGLVDFGSHTVDHARMTRLPVSEMQRQAVDSRAALEDILGRAVTMFAYPYGQLADFSLTTTRVLQEAGYQIAATTHWGTSHSAEDLLRLRRISFAERDSGWVVQRKLEGWYDWIGVKERIGFAVRSFRRGRA